jgi:hypothetical protein
VHLVLLNFSCFFVLIYRSCLRSYMFLLTDLEEPSTEDFDPDYTADLGDNLLGATSHPTS